MTTTTLIYSFAAVFMGVLNAVLSGVNPTSPGGIGFALGMPILGALVAGVANLFRRRHDVGKAMFVASAIGLSVTVLQRLTT